MINHEATLSVAEWVFIYEIRKLNASFNFRPFWLRKVVNSTKSNWFSSNTRELAFAQLH